MPIPIYKHSINHQNDRDWLNERYCNPINSVPTNYFKIDLTKQSTVNKPFQVVVPKLVPQDFNILYFMLMLEEVVGDQDAMFKHCFVELLN